MTRGIATSVPFSVRARSASADPRRGTRMRMPSRRAWNSVQFDVDVTSRYLPWVGIHASQSYLRARDCAEVAAGDVDHAVRKLERVEELASPR